MKVFGISSPVPVPHESEKIVAFLERNVVDFFNIRRPDASVDDIRRILDKIPVELYSRINLHEHHSLALEYGLGGVHLNRRFPVVPEDFHGIVGRSCHSIDELGHCDYDFLSPVFDSISKNSYKSNFEIGKLRGKVGQSTVALGGVIPDYFPLLSETGFGGAAMLGYLWSVPQDDVFSRILYFKSLCCSS